MTTNSNRRAIDMPLEVEKNIMKCIQNKPSLVPSAFTPHDPFLGLILTAKNDEQLLDIVKGMKDRLLNQLRTDIKASYE